jgi:hypothetical protein
VYEIITTKSYDHLPSGGDQKQIFGGIGQDHVQKAAANNRYNANQSTLDAEQAYKCVIPHCSGGHAVRRIGALAVQLLHALRAVVTAAAVLLTAFAYQRTKTLVIAAVFNPFVAASPDPRGVVNLNYRGGSVIRWAVCR